jgi:hypothetical protein
VFEFREAKILKKKAKGRGQKAEDKAKGRREGKGQEGRRHKEGVQLPNGGATVG